MDDHALAGGQAVGLDDDRGAALAYIVEGGLEFGELAVLRGWYAVAFHERLRECLRPFELRRRGPRAETAQAGVLETVDDAGDERSLGSDDRQVDVLGLRQPEQAVDVLGTDVDVPHARLVRRPGVAGRDDHGIYALRLCDLPRQRMFASAATDDQYLHESRPLSRRSVGLLVGISVGNAACP